MKQVTLGKSGLQVSALALGCAKMGMIEVDAAAKQIAAALEQGITYFDNADIYSDGRGSAERVFGAAWKQLGIDRSTILVQSKCGILPGSMYDCSKEHILASVDASLQRLQMDYLDTLVLHRPDALMEPEEVAEAFDELERSGKVRFFGVSNMRPMQIELLKKCVRQPLVVDQLQFSVAHSGMVRGGMEVNMLTDGAADRDGSVLDYCRLKDITVQAWSPLKRAGHGPFLQDPEMAPLQQALAEVGQNYGITPAAAAVAWLLRHPANAQVLVGTMNPEHLAQLCKAADVRLTRQEWYRIYLAAGNILP